MFSRIRHLVVKELIELGQDPRLFGIVIVAPIIQLVLLTYAATTDVRNVPVLIADADRSASSRELIDRFNASPTFTLAGVVGSTAEVEGYIERGDAWIAVGIPPGYGRAIEEGRQQVVQIVADGSDSNSAGVSLGYATNLIALHGRAMSVERARSQGLEPAGPSLEPVVRVWFNPGLESRDFMVPGVVALLLLMVTTNLSAMGIVREKEIGTLEQLNVTPLRRSELIIGKLLPYAFVGIVDVVLVLSVALLWFEIPMRGSLALLFGMTLIYLLCTLGLGLFVSTISSTQQQAMMTTTFFFLLPMVLLSGFVFPIENMPDVVQPVTYLIPLRYFLVILRSIFLKGVGLETVWPQALALATWGIVVLGLAIARSSKRAA
ncbi:MAG: ABC transporter permease [Vicinamibacterales bacterium]